VRSGFDAAAEGRSAKPSKTTETTMINVQTAGVALALSLAFAAIATPALAKNGATHRGFTARAQAIEVLDEGVSFDRAKALRECSARVGGFKGYNQQSTPRGVYRACMDEHGQPE
jgi:hypothetical protein